MIRTMIAIVVCLVLAGVANGTHETLQHHYSASVFPEPGEKGYVFWSPKISWTRKYTHWPDDQTPAYFGAKNVLVWTTDGYHLTKFLYHGFLRLALVVLAISLWGQAFKLTTWGRIAAGAGLWLVLAGIQAVGFHLMYSLILI